MNIPLKPIVLAKLRMARHSLLSVKRQSRLKVSVVSIASILLWLAAFIGFYEGITWIKQFEVVTGVSAVSIGDIIILRLVSIFSLALFFMLVFSNILVAYSTLYTSKETPFLLGAPMTYRYYFFGRFIECVIFSSWASAYLCSPLILAYGLTNHAPLTFYIAAILFYLPFVTMPAAMGALIAIILVRIQVRISRSAIIAVCVIVLVALFLYLRGVFQAAGLFEDPMGVQVSLSVMLQVSAQAQSPWMPSHWITQGLVLVAAGRLQDGAYYLLLLISNALMFSMIAGEMAQWFFFIGYSNHTGSVRERGKYGGNGPIRLLEKHSKWLPEPVRSLIIKDIRLFWREPAQWGQFAVFFGIMAVYVATLGNRPIPGYEYYRSWVLSMNIGATTLILATLTSRFVFPLISLEGKRFWVLGLAPMTLRQLVRQKFWLSVVTTSLFTLGFVILSCVRLGVEPLVFVLALYSIVMANIALSGLAVGLGALYPNFQEDNPARIVSGMGGTLNFLLSMAYVALVVTAETILLQWRVMLGDRLSVLFWWSFGAVLLFIAVLSALCMYIPLHLGLKNLEKAEF